MPARSHMPSPRTTTLSGKHRCTICSKAYSTNSHLRRHEATHFGRQDLTCPSCQAQFSRRDLAHRHIQKCGAQDHEIVLPTLKRGRKRHSCDRCSLRKLSCDTKLPCMRCRSGGTACTYQRLDHASSPATPYSEIDASSSHSQAGDTGPSASGQRGGISIEFLLNFTDPSGYRTSATIAAEVAELDEPDGGTHTQSNLEDQPMAHDQAFFDLTEVPSMFFGFPYLMSGKEAGYTSPMISGSLTPELEDAYALEVRVRELVHQLSAQHSSMLERNIDVRPAFDIQLAEAVFTVGNVRHFVWAFFRYFHYSFHILHKPTFDIQTAALPLLLALVLFGSMSSNNSDSAIAIQQFSQIAEAYIFDQLVARQMLQLPQPASIENEELELLQAGLLFLVFLNNANDLVTRRRLRLQRLPSLIAAVRASGSFAYRRPDPITYQKDNDWRGFVSDEMRLRVGMWTWLFDITLSVFLNNPPQVATAEMIGHLPCDEDLFRAESAADFERLALLIPPKPQASTLPQLMSRLLFGPPYPPSNLAHDRISSTEMLLLMYALLSLVMTSRMNLLATMTTESMLLATDRWKSLWDVLTQDNESNFLSDVGFEKHAQEFWWIARTLLRVVRTGDQSCRYLQPVPCDSGHILYDFIRKYKDCVG